MAAENFEHITTYISKLIHKLHFDRNQYGKNCVKKIRGWILYAQLHNILHVYHLSSFNRLNCCFWRSEEKHDIIYSDIIIRLSKS